MRWFEANANFTRDIKKESLGKKDKISTMVDELTAPSLLIAVTRASDSTSVKASSARAKWAMEKSREESIALRSKKTD